MDDYQEDIAVDALFVGLTRPATILGVPMGAFVVEFVLIDIIFIGIGNPFYMLLIFPVHGLLYAICYRDTGMFDDISLWMKTCGRCLNFKFWGARSFSPKSTNRINNES